VNLMSNSIIFFLSKAARIAILQLGDIFTFVGMHLTQLFWKMAQYMGIATIMLSQYAASGCVKCIPHFTFIIATSNLGYEK